MSSTVLVTTSTSNESIRSTISNTSRSSTGSTGGIYVQLENQFMTNYKPHSQQSTGSVNHNYSIVNSQFIYTTNYIVQYYNY